MASTAPRADAPSFEKYRSGSAGKVARADRPVDWAKKMSNNSALALLVYTMMQIFLVLKTLKPEGMSIAPYFGIVALVVVIIPICRGFERKWESVLAGAPDMAMRFRKDQAILWLAAIGLPFAFIAIIELVNAAI